MVKVLHWKPPKFKSTKSFGDLSELSDESSSSSSKSSSPKLKPSKSFGDLSTLYDDSASSSPIPNKSVENICVLADDNSPSPERKSRKKMRKACRKDLNAQLLDEISTPYDDSASSSPKKLLRFRYRSVDTDESDSEYAKENKSRKYPHEIVEEYGVRALDMYEMVDLREVYRPQKKKEITQKAPPSQIGGSYGNLPDYVASLLKKMQMPSDGPFGRVRPGQIIELTPKQQQYISFDPVRTPDFARPSGRARRRQNIKPNPKKEYMAFNTVYPTPEILDMIFEALNRRHVALGESLSERSPQDRRDAFILAQLHLVLATVSSGKHIFRYSKEMARDLATAALSYMRKKGERLELVEPGLFEFGDIYVGYRAHFNFQAKRTDIPDAPVETYFAQLRIYHYNCERTRVAVDCCVSLGQSDLLPCEADNRGCQYCTKFVHHPVDGCVGMKWGFSIWSEELSRRVEI